MNVPNSTHQNTSTQSSNPESTESSALRQQESLSHESDDVDAVDIVVDIVELFDWDEVVDIVPDVDLFDWDDKELVGEVFELFDWVDVVHPGDQDEVDPSVELCSSICNEGALLNRTLSLRLPGAL